MQLSGRSSSLFCSRVHRRGPYRTMDRKARKSDHTRGPCRTMDRKARKSDHRRGPCSLMDRRARKSDRMMDNLLINVNYL